MPLCGFMPQGCVNIGSKFTERLSKWGKFFQLGFFFSAAGTKGERKRVQMKGEEEEEMNGGTEESTNTMVSHQAVYLGCSSTAATIVSPVCESCDFLMTFKSVYASA